jgi:hypothetical protein
MGVGMEVQEYIDSLSPNKQDKLNYIREAIKKAVPKQFEEVVAAGSLIRYELPLELYPKTYNKQPLMYLGLAKCILGWPVVPLMRQLL